MAKRNFLLRFFFAFFMWLYWGLSHNYLILFCSNGNLFEKVKIFYCKAAAFCISYL